MSDNIPPLEIQMEIIQRIPDIKWVIQYRSVSKAWKSMIDSNKFVTAHTLRHQSNQHHHHLFILKQEDRIGGAKVKKFDDVDDVTYVSIVDDDTFPHRKRNLFVPYPIKKIGRGSVTVDGCHGLFCFYEYETSTAVIWNPSIRKTVAIKVPENVPPELGYYYWTVVGFAICPAASDPKLVKITYVYLGQFQDVITGTQVEVFTLSSGGGTNNWRSPLGRNFPHKSIEILDSQAVINGVIYWKAVDRIKVDDDDDTGAEFRNHNLIMSFDFTSEEFTKVNLPDHLAVKPDADFSVYNLRESLAVVEYDDTDHVLWMMMIGHGCTRSFHKLYSINAPIHTSASLGFRKTGAPIMELEDCDHPPGPNALAIYEPESENTTDIGIHGLQGSFVMHSYKETLLLLGH